MQFKTIENKIDSYVNNESGKKLECKFYVGKIGTGNYVSILMFILILFVEKMKKLVILM